MWKHCCYSVIRDCRNLGRDIQSEMCCCQPCKVRLVFVPRTWRCVVEAHEAVGEFCPPGVAVTSHAHTESNSTPRHSSDTRSMSRQSQQLERASARFAPDDDESPQTTDNHSLVLNMRQFAITNLVPW